MNTPHPILISNYLVFLLFKCKILKLAHLLKDPNLFFLYLFINTGQTAKV